MSIKMTGCMNIAARMPEEDQHALLDRLDAYRAKGIPAERAQVMAARDTLAEIRADRDEFLGQTHEQHPDLAPGGPDDLQEVRDASGEFGARRFENAFRRLPVEHARDVNRLIDEEQRAQDLHERAFRAGLFDSHPETYDDHQGQRDVARDMLDDAVNKGDFSELSREVTDEHDRPTTMAGYHADVLRAHNDAVEHHMKLREVPKEPIPVAEAHELPVEDVLMNKGSPDQTETPEFKKWFGDSKAVDEKGQPRVMYTGTSKDTDFSKFKAPKNGIWFSTDPKVASDYARENDSRGLKYNPEKRGYDEVNTADRVLPVYLKMENPKVYDSWPDSVRKATNYKAAQGKLFEQLKAEGHDGVIMGDNHVVFDPTQIKSAIGNRGTFNEHDADFLHSEVAPDPAAIQEEREALAGKPPGPRASLQPPQPTAPIPRSASVATRVAQKASALASKLGHDLLDGVLPLSSGSRDAQASVKDYANAERLSQYQWKRFDEILKKNYTPEQLERMGDAAEEENLIRGGDMDAAPDKGLASLPKDQRQVLEVLHVYADDVLARAKLAGLYKGDGLPFWMPRITVVKDAEGNYLRPRDSTTKGQNVVTTAPSYKGRNHKLREDTEAAAKALFGDGAEVVRNLRAMPLALARAERAIAGKNLIDSVKSMGLAQGLDLVRPNEAPGYEKIDMPGLGGANIFVTKEWAGPLRSVLYEPPGKWEARFMAAKTSSVGLIMYSPMIHNMVIFGKAFPSVWSTSGVGGKAAFVGTGGLYGIYKMAQLYGKGAGLRDARGGKAVNDFMRGAIMDGLVPFTHRGTRQDITGIVDDPTLKAGQGPISRAAGAAVGLASKSAGEAVSRGLDKAGDVWHNTLLWNRIADLQLGLYADAKSHFQAELLAKGFAPEAAARAAGLEAAHLANRYTGALPAEAMSQGTRKMANILLFSRSFTLGNLALYKDAVQGLPSEVRAQLEREHGAALADEVNSGYRRKAMSTLAVDIGLMYVANSVAQDAADAWLRDKSGSEIAQGYKDRFHAAMSKAANDPTAVLPLIGHPFSWLHSFFTNSENEPGKEARVRWADLADNTRTYGRLPFGKTGEDIEGWSGDFFNTAWKKLGSTIRPALEVATAGVGDNKGTALGGQQLWAPSDSLLKTIGKAVLHVAAGAVPVTDVTTAADLLTSGDKTLSPQGEDLAKFDRKKLLLPMVSGVTMSRGYPGGAQAGELHMLELQQRKEVAAAMPDIRKLLKTGDDADKTKAIEIMRDRLHWDASKMISTIEEQLAPSGRVNPARILRDAKAGLINEDERNRLQQMGLR